MTTAAAPAASAPTSSPSAPSGGNSTPSSGGGAGPQSAPSASMGTSNAIPTGRGPAPSGGQKPAEKKAEREAIKVKHKHALEDGSELELDLDITEHVFGHKRKIKSDKEEREVSVEEAFERFPMADGAFRRMEEASTTIKQAETLRERVRDLGEKLKDPKRVWGELERVMGGREKVDEAVMQRVADIIANEKMTPAQREAKRKSEETERAYEERERALKAQEQGLTKREQAVQEKVSKDLQAKYAREWPEHLERHGLKATPRAMALMAETLGRAKRNKIDLSEDGCAKIVARELKELASGFVEAERKTEIEELNAQPGSFAASTSTPRRAAPPSQRNGRPLSYDDIREANAARDREAARRR